jgi:bacteriocin biosynthesis cyclodehydratase domain-containing protein
VRPLLKPALRRLWRDPSTLQLGIDPRYAVVLAGVEVADSSLLDLIDGTRELAALRAEAERRGHEPDRVADLLTTLDHAGLLDDVPSAAPKVDARQRPDMLSLSLLHRAPGAAGRVMADRAAAAVEVLGGGRVGATIAMLLVAAGVGHLTLTDSGAIRPADFAPGGLRAPGARQGSRGEAVGALLGNRATKPAVSASARTGRTVTSTNDNGKAAATVVLAPVGSVVPPEWLGQVRQQPHLPVIVRETTAIIGPLVLPGRTPCLRCVELTRGDRDPVWPVLAAQLIGEPQGVEPCDIALASAAASIATLHVLAWLDGGDHGLPQTIGGVFELSLADLALRRRTVTAHPGCGCGAIDLDAAVPYLDL